MPFSPLFVPAEMAEAVGDRAWIGAMLEAEAALARAEASAGVIPEVAAAEIARCCDPERFDAAALAEEARAVANPAEPLARSLRRAVTPDAARYVHFGATSQDIVDTAAMLVTRRALACLDAELTDLASSLAALAERHRDTLMVGRTLLQQAVPITFGLKAAGWLEGVSRARSALRRLHPECLAVQLGGAAGTLAALDDAGPPVIEEYARLLRLAAPALPWHTERSRIAQIGAALAAEAGTLDKIALDIILLSQTEVGEVAEGSDGSRGGSSTMPQKRNPVGSVLTRACARQAQAAGETLLRCMAQEHERAAGAWQAEWQALSDALAFTGGAAHALAGAVSGLQVDAARMREHLDRSRGLVMAERVSLLLSERAGRATAHELLRAASGRIQSGAGTLRDALLADEEVRRHLSAPEIDAALDPATYLGATGAFIDRALAHHRQVCRQEAEE
ncbi:MAG TPA: 3-carboxy-cis,cis-muconate cycloisomerase [Chloroflexota bacterium]|nr:3-carboxy-cis,cis-muconate cycloisomerase [Chloroflexota bacterium]